MKRLWHWLRWWITMLLTRFAPGRLSLEVDDDIAQALLDLGLARRVFGEVCLTPDGVQDLMSVIRSTELDATGRPSK